MNRLLYVFSGLMVLFFAGNIQAAKLQDRNDGTVMDSRSGLIWQKEASGKMPWLEGVRFCNQLDLAGMRGWRLPFKDELKTLLKVTGEAPHIDRRAFPKAGAEVYWSLSREEQQPDQVWGISFADGKPYMFDRKNFNFQARCMIETAEAVYLPLLNKWADAWSAQDVDRYLSCYGQQFTPDGKLTREQWAEQRRDRLTRPKSIKVTVSDIKVVSEEGSMAEVMFQQEYRSATYRDQVIKVLNLSLERGELVIVGEKTISKVN